VGKYERENTRINIGIPNLLLKQLNAAARKLRISRSRFIVDVLLNKFDATSPRDVQLNRKKCACCRRMIGGNSYCADCILGMIVREREKNDRDGGTCNCRHEDQRRGLRGNIDSNNTERGYGGGGQLSGVSKRSTLRGSEDLGVESPVVHKAREGDQEGREG